MSWLYSRALVEEYSQATCSDGEQSLPLSTQPIPRAYLSPDRMTDFSRISRFGMTFGPLTDSHGEALLTWYLAGSRAKRSALPLEGQTTQQTFGPTCVASSERLSQDASSPRTLQSELSTLPQATARRWVTGLERSRFPRETWVVTAFGSDTGYLHTPTATGNYCAPSMQKHAGCREYLRVFGKVTPASHEYLMGWPIGWTALEPLVTVRSLTQPRMLSACSPNQSNPHNHTP